MSGDAAEPSSGVHVLFDRGVLIQNKEFLIMLAHELRNPLAPIFNSLHLIEKNAGDNILLKNAQRVLNRQARHMTGVIENLLDVSRLIENRLQIYAEEVEIGSTITHAVETARSVIDSRRHTLTVRTPEDALWLKGDPARLQQAIVSLLVNAAKYTETGGKISLTVSNNEKEVLISIKDSGIGIPHEALPHVFELFTRGDHSTHIARGGGLGIGLTLVQAIAQLHGGSVEAHSEGIDKGSEFILCLPLIRIGGPPQTPPEEEPEWQHARSLVVLVVDDHIDTAESTGVVLRMMGHTPRLAHSGRAALQQAHLYEPDVVLLDIGLPGVDGYQVARELRQNFPETVLVAVTGYGQEIDRKRSALAGFDCHLVKPVKPETLPKVLRLRKRRGSSS